MIRRSFRRTVKNRLSCLAAVGVLVAACSALLRAQPPPPSPSVTITSLGALVGATHGAAIDINNAGLVVGYSGDFLNYCCAFIPLQPHGFLWNPATNQMHDLGVSMRAFGGGINSFGTAIGDSGLIAGYGREAYFENAHLLFTSDASTVIATAPWEPFVSSTWTMTIRGSLFGGETIPHDMNASDVAVGVDGNRPWVWDAVNGLVALPLLGSGASGAEGINDTGAIVGWAYVTGRAHPVRWDAVTRAVQDIGLPAGWQEARAEGVNASGVVTGYGFNAAGRTRAFVWTDGSGFTVLPTLGGLDGWAEGINASGKVVGYSTTAGGATHAFAWDPATNVMLDLGVLPGDTSSHAYAINDSDQIVGRSVGAVEQPVLWTATFVAPDNDAPEISCEAPDGQWHASNVSLACTAEDTGSGLANAADASFSLTTNVASNTETAAASTNSRIVCDNNGNCATAGPIGGNQIDRKAPSVTLTSPTATNYLLGQAVNAGFSCADGGSGVASCVGSAANGAAIDTSTAGSHTFAVAASDAVGNTGAANVGYGVAFGQCLLYDPTKAHKSGSTIPIKLQLCNAAGGNVSSASIPLVATSVYLVSNNAPGPLEDSGQANPDFQFRFDVDKYIFNLSLKGFSQGTYALAFTAGGDPTVHTVTFQVK